MKLLKVTTLLFFLIFFESACSISLKGVTIPPDVQTFFVEDFRLSALEAPADLNQRFGEALRNKVRNESRLTLKEIEPDMVFSGNIRSFRITPEAVTAGATAALNKLEISIEIELVYPNKPNEGWKSKPYTFFRNFDATQDFQNIQDNLIREIFDLFTEQIFNDAFSQW
ncbi:MAG: LPS assembly lipoprotein LptE [Saprospiraceae bacterium]